MNDHRMTAHCPWGYGPHWEGHRCRARDGWDPGNARRKRENDEAERLRLKRNKANAAYLAECAERGAARNGGGS